MGIGDWGLDNTQSPIPNPNFQKFNLSELKRIILFVLI